MAVFVLLIKEYEDAEKVVYKYGPNEEVMGKIEYNKIDRTFKEIEAIEQEGDSNEFFINLAAQRISRIVVREKGVFPERTTIES
ncbi:hypothetical protein ACFLKB_00705 [Clostridium sp. FAM 1755]|uniref:hypothetical protein n=1 Tax=Clostridium TaxID=1485 RepID=UPI0028FDF1C0|nr:hypothetical protein [Clostridium botulinum]